MVGGRVRQAKVTSVTGRAVPKVYGLGLKRIKELVEVAERASAGAARISAGAAGSGSGRQGGTRTGRALGGHGEHTELWAQLLALAFGAPGFVAAEDQGFKLVLTIFTDVFENRHDDHSRGMN